MMRSTDFAPIVSPLMRLKRGGRVNYATGGASGIGPFGGPGWSLPYRPGALSAPIAAPNLSSPATAFADPYTYLANESGGGVGGPGPGPGGTGTGPGPASGGVSPAGTTGDIGVGPVGQAALTGLSAVTGAPVGLATNAALTGINVSNQNTGLNAIGAEPIGLMGALSALASSLTGGIIGVSAETQAAKNAIATNAALGIGQPTSSVDFAEHNNVDTPADHIGPAPGAPGTTPAPDRADVASDSDPSGGDVGGASGAGAGGASAGDTGGYRLGGALSRVRRRRRVGALSRAA